MKLIIDCDAGLDDSMAIMMALHSYKKKEIDILAITCVQGNTTVDHSARNVARILDSMAVDDVIPVYKGARSPLVKECEWDHPQFHGVNGFGDVEFPEEPNLDRIKEGEHGVNAMIRLVNENPGEISLVLLGPLTNLALAMKLDHDFSRKVKGMFAMGGNYDLLGKTADLESAEFNFSLDPDAAFVVLQNVKCPLYIFSWELCEFKMNSTVEWRMKAFKDFDNAHTKLQEAIERPSLLTYPFETYYICDQLALAGAINPDIILKTSSYYVSVDIVSEKRHRGRTIIDSEGKTGREPNVIFVDDMDRDLLERMIVDTYRG